MAQNLSLKVFALFLALLIWYLAKQGTEAIQMSFFAPVVFRDLPANLQVVSDPSQVNISAKTASRRGSAFSPTEVQAVINLKNSSEGTYQYVLTRDNIVTPAEDVSIISITPSQVALSIEELIERDIPIKPRYQGSLQRGYMLEHLKISPSMVKVRGPKSIIAPLEAIYSTEIDLHDLNSSIEMVVQLDLPDTKLEILSTDIDYYKAIIKVASLPIKKRYDNVAIFFRNIAYETEINPRTFNIFVEGPAEILNKLDPTQLYGVVDLDNYNPGSYKVDPTPILPSEISLLEQWPIVSLWVKPQKLKKE